MQALLFDMDGTLVDLTVAVERTWQGFAQRYSLNLEAVLNKAHGRPTAETVDLFAPEGVDLKQETANLIAAETADVDGIVAIAGARALLQQLLPYQWAIVTSASRELAICRLAAAGLLVPEVLISVDDVAQGKPAPEGYLTAAQILHVSPKDCLVFEDSLVGYAAARSANMATIMVGSQLPVGIDEPQLRITDFTQLTLHAFDDSMSLQCATQTNKKEIVL